MNERTHDATVAAQRAQAVVNRLGTQLEKARLELSRAEGHRQRCILADPSWRTTPNAVGAVPNAE